MGKDIKDKVVVITGAAGGIGSATARLLAKEGAILVLTDIKKTRSRSSPGKCGPGGRRPSVHVHDVRDPESWKALTDRVSASSGGSTS